MKKIVSRYRFSLQWLVLSLVYPFLSVVLLHLKRNCNNYNIGIYTFFSLTAFSLFPTVSSDIGNYLIAFENYGNENAPMPMLDPISSILFKLLGYYGLPFNLYYLTFALLSAYVLSSLFKTLFTILGGEDIWLKLPIFTSIIFVLVNPIILMLNSRFHLLIMFVALGMLEIAKKQNLKGLITLTVGGCIHFFGFVVLIMAALSMLTLKLNTKLFTIFVVFMVIFAPQVSTLVAYLQLFGLNSFADLLTFYEGVVSDRVIKKSWHLILAQPLLYMSVTFAFMFTLVLHYRKINASDETFVRLTKISLVLIGLCVFLRYIPELNNRFERFVITLVLIWHLYFHYRIKPISYSSIVLLYIPSFFYSIVIWRRLLDQYSVNMFLPTPVIVYRDLPLVTQFLGFID